MRVPRSTEGELDERAAPLDRRRGERRAERLRAFAQGPLSERVRHERPTVVDHAHGHAAAPAQLDQEPARAAVARRVDHAVAREPEEGGADRARELDVTREVELDTRSGARGQLAREVAE